MKEENKIKKFKEENESVNKCWLFFFQHQTIHQIIKTKNPQVKGSKYDNLLSQLGNPGVHMSKGKNNKLKEELTLCDL